MYADNREGLFVRRTKKEKNIYTDCGGALFEMAQKEEITVFVADN